MRIGASQGARLAGRASGIGKTAELDEVQAAVVPFKCCCAAARRYGEFTAHAYRSLLDGTEHVALVAGHVRHAEAVLTRVHSESMLGDLFGAARCDSGSQLDAALAAMAARGSGVLVYLRGQQGRGLGLAEELQAHAVAETSDACENPATLEDATFPVGVGCYSVGGCCAGLCQRREVTCAWGARVQQPAHPAGRTLLLPVSV